MKSDFFLNSFVKQDAIYFEKSRNRDRDRTEMNVNEFIGAFDCENIKPPEARVITSAPIKSNTINGSTDDVCLLNSNIKRILDLLSRRDKSIESVALLLCFTGSLQRIRSSTITRKYSNESERHFLCTLITRLNEPSSKSFCKEYILSLNRWQINKELFSYNYKVDTASLNDIDFEQLVIIIIIKIN